MRSKPSEDGGRSEEKRKKNWFRLVGGGGISKLVVMVFCVKKRWSSVPNFRSGNPFLVAGEGVRNSCVVICQRARSASYAAIR